VDLGTDYGGWIVPTDSIRPDRVCYSIGAGADISFDLALIRRFGLTVRAVEPVESYVELARARAADVPGFSIRRAALAPYDGPLRMQVTHDPRSESVSAAKLYESNQFLEQVPGRTLPSLLAEMGDERVELLKIDVEGSEYDLVPTLDLDGLGVRVLAVQLHHSGTVTQARGLIRWLGQQRFRPVACRPAVKLTFVRGGAGDGAGKSGM
jgi:FkbM family methyltransferase